jgi:hypothetical protein
MTWVGTRNACGKMQRAGHGLFCSNFWLGREGFCPCRNVWCGKCYRESGSNPFPRLDDNEEANGSDLDLDTTESNQWHRYKRNGDHLMGIPFECNLCSFRNVTGWDPVLGDQNDHFTLVAIRRVLLDVMWAREPDTVARNWARAKRDYITAVNHLSLRTELLLPVLGNPTVTDRVGMGVAILTVVTLLRAGINSSNIQCSTMRKTPTWYGNAFDAGSEYTCNTVVGLDQKKEYLSSSHTLGKWFSRFMRGARLRMGMVRRQNEALTLELVLKVCSIAEGEWRAAQNPARQIDVEDTVCFMLLGFGAELRGEEVPLVNLEGLLTFWMETKGEEDRYMMTTLQGWFKGEVDRRWHIVPICDVTRLGIPFRLWMEPIMYWWVRLQGRSNGWLFEQKPGKPAKFGAYQDYFRTLIDLARQQDPRLLPSLVETTNFSLWRSLHRGAVLETTNHMDIKVIELINRWRKKEAARGLKAGLPMRQVYTQVQSTLPTMKEFSRAL